MTALAIEWIWWIFATFGIVGIICLWIFAPTAAAMVLKAVVSFFQLAFAYRIGCALIAAAIAFAIADYHRARVDEADWQAQMAAFNAAQDTRDKQIDADARAAVRKEIDDENAATVQTTNEVKVYEQALPILPPTDTICRVGNDADKLRVIAGAPPSQHKLRMPALRRKRTGT